MLSLTVTTYEYSRKTLSISWLLMSYLLRRLVNNNHGVDGSLLPTRNVFIITRNLMRSLMQFKCHSSLPFPGIPHMICRLVFISWFTLWFVFGIPWHVPGRSMICKYNGINYTVFVNALRSRQNNNYWWHFQICFRVQYRRKITEVWTWLSNWK